jgi:hypothetical protein
MTDFGGLHFVVAQNSYSDSLQPRFSGFLRTLNKSSSNGLYEDAMSP